MHSMNYTAWKMIKVESFFEVIRFTLPSSTSLNLFGKTKSMILFFPVHTEFQDKTEMDKTFKNF